MEVLKTKNYTRSYEGEEFIVNYELYKVDDDVYTIEATGEWPDGDEYFHSFNIYTGENEVEDYDGICELNKTDIAFIQFCGFSIDEDFFID